MKHISKAKKCKAIYGEDYDDLKNAKAMSVKLAKSRKYQRANVDKIRRNQAEYNREHAEEINLRQAEYNREHAEEINLRQAEYDREHAEEIKLRQAKYNRQHRVQICSSQRKRVALNRSKATAKDRLRLFSQEIKDGPTHVCMSCDRSLFLRGVKIIAGDPKLKFEELVGKDFLLEKILHATDFLDFYIFCHTCNNSIKKKTIPKLHWSNGLHLDEVCEDLKLTELEQQLIAKINIFMKIKKTPKVSDECYC